MSEAALVFDELFLEHRSSGPHPERPERLTACRAALEEAGLWERFELLPCRPVSLEEASLVHDPTYLRRLFVEASGRAGWLDPDTYYCPRSVEAARLAAGGTLELAMAVLRRRYRCGLALVRPPGHHAERGRAMGFCLLGNLAIAAAALRRQGARVAVVDFDVHHGNGTQHAFEEDPDLFFISAHCYDGRFYPGSGSADEVGRGAGQGATLNLPLRPGAGDQELLDALDSRAGPALRRFAPELLLVSAGFDGHQDDPLGPLRITDGGFEQLLDRLASWATELCGGRWLAVLEGGYDLPALSRGMVALAGRLLQGPARGRSGA